MNYTELSNLPAEAYLTPDTFRTSFDAMNAARGYHDQQYRKGLEIGKTAKAIYINDRSVWSADMLDGGCLSSSEGIGYHSCTADLLRGFLDSGATILVHRMDAPTPIKIK